MGHPTLNPKSLSVHINKFHNFFYKTVRTKCTEKCAVFSVSTAFISTYIHFDQCQNGWKSKSWKICYKQDFEKAARPTPLQKTINPCKLNTYKGFLFRVHRKVHSFLGFLEIFSLTYPCYKISVESRSKFLHYLVILWFSSIYDVALVKSIRSL